MPPRCVAVAGEEHPSASPPDPRRGAHAAADRLGTVASLFTLVQFAVMALWVLVLGRMVMSWVDPSGRNQVSALLIRATEPLLGPVRGLLPRTGAIDWSGFVVLIVLGLISRSL